MIGWAEQSVSYTILFSDEALFTKQGFFNHQNSYDWVDENPHATIAWSSQIKFTINETAGIVDYPLIGQYIL